jgi:hypothetical protein
MHQTADEMIRSAEVRAVKLGGKPDAFGLSNRNG